MTGEEMIICNLEALTHTQEVQRQYLSRIAELLIEIRDQYQGSLWACGCGHVNGANLALCAKCNRSPGETR